MLAWPELFSLSRGSFLLTNSIQPSVSWYTDDMRLHRKARPKVSLTLLSVSCALVLHLSLAPSWVEIGHLLKLKCAHSPLILRILSSTSIQFTLTTMQRLNLARTHTKRITVQVTGPQVHRMTKTLVHPPPLRFHWLGRKIWSHPVYSYIRCLQCQSIVNKTSSHCIG